METWLKNISNRGKHSEMKGIKRDNPLNWLLEPDNPGVRYLTLRNLMDTPADQLLAAGIQAHCQGPIAQVLANMHEEGYWEKPGAGYYPKYTGSVWSVILLAQLGATPEIDKRVTAACSYMLDHSLAKGGQFTANGLPSGTADCLQGNLCASLLDLNCSDSRLDMAFDWMARSVTAEGVAPKEEKQAPARYYAGKCGPNFACGSNNNLPCAWGAVKVMLAFSKLPEEKRTPPVEKAIQKGVDFLFSTDPALAAYPCGYSNKPSGNWWKFGFPVFYVTDLLQLVETLVGLGLGRNHRLSNAIKIIRDKQDENGRWPLEYDYAGKTWVNFGLKNQPSKWVTIRALNILKSL
jgi:hypothetical protein